MKAWQLIALVVAVGASACGLHYTIDNDQLRDLTIDNKLLLFDAQNDVSIALDERENIRAQIRSLHRDISDAEHEADQADADEDRFEDKNEPKKAKLAEMAKHVYGLKEDYLESQLDYLHDKLDAQAGLIEVARAKFELAKAKLVKANNVRGAADIDVKDFEDQVDDYVQRARGEQKDLAETQKEVAAAKATWLKQRGALNKASGGGLGSPWAEDNSLWEGWQ